MRDLKDTPFSRDRLLIWAVAVYGLVALVTIAVLSYQGKAISTQLQSATMFILGVVASSLKDWLDK